MTPGINGEPAPHRRAQRAPLSAPLARSRPSHLHNVSLLERGWVVGKRGKVAQAAARGRRGQAGGFGRRVGERGCSGWACVRLAPQRRCAHTTHWLIDRQVGTAMPFSISLPLNSLATALGGWVGGWVAAHASVSAARHAGVRRSARPPPLTRRPHSPSLGPSPFSRPPTYPPTLPPHLAHTRSLGDELVASVTHVHHLGPGAARRDHGSQRICAAEAWEGGGGQGVRARVETGQQAWGPQTKPTRHPPPSPPRRPIPPPSRRSRTRTHCW